MKAAVLVRTGDPHKAFEIQEKTAPTPKENEVLIKVQTYGLNYADVMARNGIYPAAPPMPSILGYESVGVIEEVGKSVTAFKKGDRVLAFTLFGSYAEYAVAPEDTVCILPESIPNGEATALATQYCTSIYCAEWMANIQSFERILIHAAAGGVGHAVIQIAKKKGCEIIATAGSDEKIEYLKSLGVDHAINYNKVNFEEKIESMFGKRSVHAIFDPIGGKNHKMNARLLSVGGRLIMYGISSFSGKKGTKLDQIRLALQFGFLNPLQFLIKSNGYIGVNMLHVAKSNPKIIQELLKQAIQGHMDGDYKPKMAFEGKFDEIGKAHELLEQRGTIGKLAINWDS